MFLLKRKLKGSSKGHNHNHSSTNANKNIEQNKSNKMFKASFNVDFYE